MTEQLARDAMVPEPLALDASASAQEAAEALSRPEVRAVFVCDGGRLTGVITRKTLVREVVARGLDPKTTAVGTFAEPPNATIDSSIAARRGVRLPRGEGLRARAGGRGRQARRRALAVGGAAASRRGRAADRRHDLARRLRAPEQPPRGACRAPRGDRRGSRRRRARRTRRACRARGRQRSRPR